MTGPSRWTRPEALALAAGSGLPVLDLTLGIAPDPEPAYAFASSTEPAAYPSSAGSEPLRQAAARYLLRRFGVRVDPVTAIAATAGSKEFISTAPLFLADGRRDTVLIPALGYPPYEWGARLAGLKTYRVPMDDCWRMRLDDVPAGVADRAVCLWVASPANPTGAVEDLGAVIGWARAHGVPVCSDEAYTELTWAREPGTALAYGLDGVLSVHSLSKRSNAPGLRVGFYAGDPRLVAALVAGRRASGLMASVQGQRAAVQLLSDDGHAHLHRARMRRRMTEMHTAWGASGLPYPVPSGGMFAWVAVPGGDGVAFARRFAARAGVVVTPGIEYGPAGAGHVRVAAVADGPLVRSRLAKLTDEGGVHEQRDEPDPGADRGIVATPSGVAVRR